jgi:diacylglycerol O-acyltransferase
VTAAAATFIGGGRRFFTARKPVDTGESEVVASRCQRMVAVWRRPTAEAARPTESGREAGAIPARSGGGVTTLAPGSTLSADRLSMKQTRDALQPYRLPPRMTPSDALFWYVEIALPAFRPIIAGLYLLDRHPRKGGIEAALKATIRLVPRLRQRVVETPMHLGLPQYVDDEHFDLAYHLRHVSVPKPGRMRALLDLTASLLATPLDRERPLWEAYWIDGLADGRSAFFMKMHHALVDGVGALAITRGLTQRSRKEKPPRILSGGGSKRKSTRSALGRLGQLAFDNARASASLALDAATAPARLLAHPRRSCGQIQATARGLRGVILDATQAPIRDPLAARAAGISRRLDVLEVSMSRLRTIKTPLGGTINDVILTALAGAVGAYHRKRRVQIATLNCLVPMSLRTEEERDALGNRVGMINVALPVGEARPDRRFAAIVTQTRAAKRDVRGGLYPLLASTLTLLPGAAFSWLARQSLGRVNLVCTNIPGVQETLYMAGAKVTAVYPFASPVEGTPLIVALVSYAGRMNIGIDTDPEAIPDPHRLAKLFVESLEELECLAVSAE